jgi:hypothetical protein
MLGLPLITDQSIVMVHKLFKVWSDVGFNGLTLDPI